MGELIKVTVKNDQQLVSARDLYKGVQVTTRFSKWVEQNFKDFIEGEDFTSVTGVTDMPNGGTRPIQDYALTISMAKELSMMSHTEQGKKYRKYFIELERKWNNPMEIVKRGYSILQNENTKLKLENSEMKPKALFADAVSTSNTSILVGELAKLIKQNGYDIGQQRLFKWLRNNGYLIAGNRSDRNMPTQKSLELGLFEIKERSFQNPDGSVRITKTPKVTGKGQQYFINKFLAKKEA
ncbi:bacteriophage antirepressor [Ligilactobacillus acidipiscis DSM 15836]|uniref:Bacteriophage antirepressor n=1 Tax=Ligilactobacillus acidipiscis DSM 15836 TaxID=1423716 RepID=A0ABR5PLY4_9LACO|nr:phage antirepressor KilAC domain-containing protein [Ligilactobacillus acidipiscis]KRM30326.1 bacteriophage antirepressor [Ligilactobacillus acidipiscis DSM 15836]GAW63415.1 hypothetical protein Lacidipiscis_00598 [Ligilactobacillus acidipiscis]GEN19622.1 oxidoreductase [Ligilactobacillus acidipiscis]